MSRETEARMTLSTCVHCGADSQPATTGGYCVNCGRYQVEPPTGKPDEAGRGSEATRTAAHKRVARVASVTLLGVAVLYLVFGLASLALVSQIDAAHGGAGQLFRQLAALAGFVAVFSILGWWARRKPLPASFAGAAIYAGIMVVNIVAGADGRTIAMMAVILTGLAWPFALALISRYRNA